MLSKAFIISCIAALALSAIIREPVAIVSHSSDIRPDGSFNWNYEGADGSKQQQKASVKQVAKEIVTAVEGSFSWTDPEGHHHEISYIADENGYRATGSDLPVAPEVPKAIVRALEWIATHREPDLKKKH